MRCELDVDSQGWEPPQDFAQHFVTRARTISVHNGISYLHFKGLEGSTVNGRGETYTFSKANSLQVCLYDKSKEIDVSDKRALMEGIWECAVNKDSFPDKRAKKEPGCGNEKNVSLAFGNLLSIYTRNRFTTRMAWECLKQSGLWDDLLNYY